MPWRPRMMPPVGKSGPGMMLMRSSIPRRRIFDQRYAGVDDFAEIVRGNVGRHADRDAAGAVDQEVRELRRQDRRFTFGIVVVRLEIDGVLVDVPEHLERGTRQTRFGVSIGRRRIAVDGAEIALAVDQRHAHGKILRHPDHRVVNRLVAVRMIFTDHVADDARGLDVFLVRRVALLVHRIQNAPMHRLQTVARIRQRPRHDHAHGVIEVGAFHLVEDGYGTNIGRSRRLSGGLIFRLRQRGNPVSSCHELYSVSGPPKPPLTDPAQAVFTFVFPDTYGIPRLARRRPGTGPRKGLPEGRFGPAKTPYRQRLRTGR